jgi:Ca2+-binding EF-hand superfamily protein
MNREIGVRGQGLGVRGQASSVKRLPAAIVVGLLLLGGLVQPVLAQKGTKGKKSESQDFVYLSGARPLLIRVQVRVDGKALSAVHEEFIAHLFQHVDVKGKGYLTKAEVERLPPLEHILSGGFGSFFGGFGGMGKKQPPLDIKDFEPSGEGKIMPAGLSAYYRKHGLALFQVQPEAASDAGDQYMMMLGGGGSTEPTVADVSKAIFARLDTGKTGKLTKADLAKAEKILLRLDANEDEMITIRELVPAVPRKPDDGMMKNKKMAPPVYNPLAPKPLAPEKQSILLVTTRGEAPKELATRLIERYGPKDVKDTAKIARKDWKLDDAAFKTLDANGDGFLDEKELGGFVKRTPDLNLTINLGAEEPGVTLKNKKGLGDKLKTFDGLAMLELPGARVEIRSAEETAADPYAPIMRLQWTALFQQADKNKDGYLDEQEASTFFGSAFKAMDRDGDGKVSKKEFEDYLDLIGDLQKRTQNACVSLVLSDESRGLFDLLDVNRDGRLSVREMRGAAGLIEKLGKTDKGYLSMSDMPPSHRLTVRRGPASSGGADYSAILNRIYGGGGKEDNYRMPTKGPAWFRKMDKNRDGDVSRSEWLGTEAQFREIDADGDGLISAEEADRYDKLHRKDN